MKTPLQTGTPKYETKPIEPRVSSIKSFLNQSSSALRVFINALKKIALQL